jgi:hypothetical protein
MLPPNPTRRRLRRFHDFEATTGLQHPLSTLHERRCRRPCKTRFRPAGSAFAGRASNPLGHDERFQFTSILLSRAFPDASWAHTRRKFYEIAEADRAPLAIEALRRIGDLYQVESRVRGQSAAHRLAARRAQSQPIVNNLNLWMEAQLPKLSGSGKLAEAMRYALSRWDGLTRFLHDGRIELDTNPVERAIRPVALGRKNHLFAGSDGGGVRWAILCSLIETCKLNGAEPLAYIRDVLTRMVEGHPINRLDELLPWNWVPKDCIKN